MPCLNKSSHVKDAQREAGTHLAGEAGHLPLGTINMKKIGIIGGFGPWATAVFYTALVDACRKNQHGQPHIIVWNVPVLEKLEKDLLLHGKRLTAFIPLLTGAAKNLENAGADFIVLPCNTLHTLSPSITACISIPFVSIIDATVKHLQNKHIKSVGLLGTSVTVKHNLFKQKNHFIKFILPSHSVQKVIDQSVHIFVTTGNNKNLRKVLKSATNEFQKLHIQDVLVACTDFHGFCPDTPNIRIHDTLDILVEATVNML